MYAIIEKQTGKTVISTFENFDFDSEICVSDDELQRKEDGTPYIYYKLEMVNGMYVPDLVEEQKVTDAERVKAIKAKAGAIINEVYPIHKQLNYPRGTEGTEDMYAWIDEIRRISNEAESNGMLLDDIFGEFKNG